MRKRRASRGAAAIEFVFLAPVLILLMAGVMTMGLAAYAKFRLSDAAMIAVRRCVVSDPGTCAGTAPTLLNTRWPDGAKVCTGGVVVETTVQNGIATVKGTCAFTGGVMQKFLGLSNFPIVSSAAMPF